jgi:hypothetical protein
LSSIVAGSNLDALYLSRLVRKAFAVPRFFFNQIDGEHKPDDEGLEFPSLEQARTEAVRYAGEVLCHRPDLISTGDDFRVEANRSNVELRPAGPHGRLCEALSVDVCKAFSILA